MGVELNNAMLELELSHGHLKWARGKCVDEVLAGILTDESMKIRDASEWRHALAIDCALEAWREELSK
jgi:hypothetical protein